MPLGLRLPRRRKPRVEEPAAATLRETFQPSHEATRESPAGTQSSFAASIKTSSSVDDSMTKSEPAPPRDLWDEAYKTLQGVNCKLVEQYEESIIRTDKEDAHLAPVGSFARQEQLSAVITRRLESIEKDQKSFTMAGRRVILQEQLDKVIRIIMFAKDFVSSAVILEPHTALAWAGVCVLLPVSIEKFHRLLFAS